MHVQALTRFCRISPKKAREVARAIQGLPAEEALERLNLLSRKAAGLLSKTLKSAIANAENNHDFSTEQLIVDKAVVEKGPDIKRWRAGSRGRAQRRRKRMSHIRIVLFAVSGGLNSNP